MYYRITNSDFKQKTFSAWRINPKTHCIIVIRTTYNISLKMRNILRHEHV